ncbi:thioredoxin family protein [Halioxenophilus sp. WMMB6]|uniref:thioredoxin family protein n=1 Tax=Halioxenophilus sp. WMMB6 TaxID=3073815 RepID=UPI00295EC19F|nr:thioredoxin family protein [Halioxenophilus sp. WMMB6]
MQEELWGTLGFNGDYSEAEPTPAELQALTGEVILEFGAPWCGHCQAAQPVIQSLFTPGSQVRHIKVYDGRGKVLGRSFGVKLWPTVVALRDGSELARVVRPVSSGDVHALVNALAK